MHYLGMTEAELERAGGYWTAREISQQPSVWRDIERQMAEGVGRLRSYLDPLLRRRELRIVLTGAGTSSFVGECLAPGLTRAGFQVSAVATTDLVESPDHWLSPSTPILLVSFARSGNSPESLAALDMAAQATPECHHLVFTCSREGELYRRMQGAANAHTVLLPEETNDRGFAMTSSFSGMLLAAALAFRLMPDNQSETLARWAGQILDAELPVVEKLARDGYERVVYLGGNECKGLAREAALKMLELSDGRVVAMSETPLGFRHGPKTILNRKTLVVMFLSEEPYARRYEVDVLNELRADGIAARVVALTGAGAGLTQNADTLTVNGAGSASNLALCFPYAVFAQSLALLQSLALGIKADSPNAQGVVNRVVQGVTIYPWTAAR